MTALRVLGWMEDERVVNANDGSEVVLGLSSNPSSRTSTSSSSSAVSFSGT